MRRQIRETRLEDIPVAINQKHQTGMPDTPDNKPAISDGHIQDRQDKKPRNRLDDRPEKLDQKT